MRVYIKFIIKNQMFNHKEKKPHCQDKVSILRRKEIYGGACDMAAEAAVRSYDESYSRGIL